MRTNLAPTVSAVLLLTLASTACAVSDDASDSDVVDEELATSCDLGTSCPASLRLLSARSYGEARPPAVMRDDLELVSRHASFDATPRRFAQATSRPLTFSAASAFLSATANAPSPVWVDDILLFEVLDTATGRLLDAGTVGALALRHRGGQPIRVLGAGAVRVDLASILPRDRTFRLRVSALDVAGRAETTDVFLRSDDAPSVPVIDFTWSRSGSLPGLHCIRIDEPADDHGRRTTRSPSGMPIVSKRAWDDNYLCTDRDFGLRWSYAGPLDGMVCTSITEPAEDARATWEDNFLCAPRDYGLAWSTHGPLADHACVQIVEPSDPHTWSDNYLCQRR